MGVQFSVQVTGKNTSTTGTAFTVTLPQAGLTLIGVAANFVMSIPYDASRNMIIPCGVSSGIPFVGLMYPVSIPISGLTMNVTAFDNTAGTTGAAWFYFGTPRADTLPKEAFLGVVTTAAVAAGTTATATVTFPSGGIKLTGFTAIDQQSKAQSNFSFAVAAGYTMNLFSNDSTNIWEPKTQIIPLDSIGVGQTLSVTVTWLSSTTTTIVFVFYYSGV